MLNKALFNGERRDASVDLKVASALLRKLLEPEPEKRLAHFESAPTFMKGVLEEPFFQGQDMYAATLNMIVKNQEVMKQEQAKQTALLLENKFELLHTRKVPPSSNPP